MYLAYSMYVLKLVWNKKFSNSIYLKLTITHVQKFILALEVSAGNSADSCKLAVSFGTYITGHPD